MTLRQGFSRDRQGWLALDAIDVALCTALDYSLAGTGSMARAPKGLAIAAAVTQVIPYVNLGIAPFMWMLFMFSADATKKELWDRTAGQRA